MATPAGRGAARRIQVPSDQEEITTEAVLRITYTSNYNSFESQSKKSGRSQQIDTVHPVQSSSYIHWRRSRSNAGLDSYHDKIKPSTENKKIKRTTEHSRPYRSPENYREKLMIQAENKGSQEVTTKKQRKRKKKKSRIAEALEEEEALSWESSESNKRQQQSFFLTSEICNGDQDVGVKHTDWWIDRWIDVLEH